MGLDFEANKPRMYSELRVKMGELYADVNVEFFGPELLLPLILKKICHRKTLLTLNKLSKRERYDKHGKE